MFQFQVCSLSLVVQSLNCVWLFGTPRTAAWSASLSFTISQSLLKLMSIESVMPFNHLILCHPLLLLLSTFPSFRVFFNESALHIRWPKYWSFRISPSDEHSGLISFRIDWMDLLALQGALKSLLQHHSKSINPLALSFLSLSGSNLLKEHWTRRQNPGPAPTPGKSNTDSWSTEVSSAVLTSAAPTLSLWCYTPFTPCLQVLFHSYLQTQINEHQFSEEGLRNSSISMLF